MAWSSVLLLGVPDGIVGAISCREMDRRLGVCGRAGRAGTSGRMSAICKRLPGTTR